ncbi:MAG TPA: VOC family protein [Kofleriaceae bacterium]|jgi:catechol 2,3-dioxygenase-like lactoylglutathione lyase family enzyme
MASWFARPVLHVSNLEAAIRFYVERLGFAKAWQYEDEVAQVEREECALILSSQWPEKVGKGLTFISPGSAAAVDAIRADLEARGAEIKEGSWGYRILIVTDPDGNELYFNYPNE